MDLNAFEKLSLTPHNTYTFDPDTTAIRNICNSMIGAKISFNYRIEFPGAQDSMNPLMNCNIIGDCMENIVAQQIKQQIPTFASGPRQASPDFQNNEYEWELKTFHKTPGFDVSNFSSFIEQVIQPGGLLRKLFRTQYMVFEYEIRPGGVTIVNFWTLNLWQLFNYDGKYPISLQCKRNIWYNLRPSSTKSCRMIQRRLNNSSIHYANRLQSARMKYTIKKIKFARLD